MFLFFWAGESSGVQGNVLVPIYLAAGTPTVTRQCHGRWLALSSSISSSHANSKFCARLLAVLLSKTRAAPRFFCGSD